MSALDEPNIRTALIPLKNAVKALDAEKLETRRVVGMLQRAQEDAKRHAEEHDVVVDDQLPAAVEHVDEPDGTVGPIEG
jgi:hypothetical protein